jgi:hypothetical protein
LNLAELDIETARIRAMQSMYGREHQALTQWGKWSGDRRGIFPRMAQAQPQYRHSEGEEYGEVTDPDAARLARIAKVETRSTPMERHGYDEKLALILDERIHSPGGLDLEVRHCIRVAYVTREIPEGQFPRRSGCNLDAFCERLETALRFVRRFL